MTAARQAAALAPTASGGKERNGDYPQICQLVDAVLGSVGFDVVAASGQDAALAAAAASEFDVVVSDVHMPGMSGPELYATLLRLQPRLPLCSCRPARHSQARSRRFPGSFQVRGRRS